MNKREDIKQSKRCVIKIGSALLTNDGAGLNKTGIATWVEQISTLRKSGVEVVLVPEIGPKAFDTLQAFDISIYKYEGELSVRDTLYQYFEDKLTEVHAPSTKGKH